MGSFWPARVATGRSGSGDAESGAALRTLKGHSDWVLAVTFSPDGKTLASGGRDKAVRLWQGQRRGKRSPRSGDTPDWSARLPSLRMVRLWPRRLPIKRFGSGTRKRMSAKPFSRPSRECRERSPFRRTARLWPAAGKTGVVTLWDAATGKVSATLDGQGAAVWCLVFSPQGGTLATAGTDGKVLLWDIPTGEVRTALEGQDSLVTALTFLADGTALVSGAVDGSIHRWDAVSPALAELSGPGDETRLVLFSPDGGQLVAAGVGSHVVVYDLESGTQKYRLRQSSNAYSADISSDGKLLAVSGREILLANLETGKAIGSFGKGEPALRAVAFTPDAKTLVTGNDDGMIQVWDVATKRVKKTLPQQPLNIYDLAISPDGKTLATATGDYKRRAESGEIKLWGPGERKTAANPARLFHLVLRRRLHARRRAVDLLGFPRSRSFLGHRRALCGRGSAVRQAGAIVQARLGSSPLAGCRGRPGPAHRVGHGDVATEDAGRRSREDVVQCRRFARRLGGRDRRRRSDGEAVGASRSRERRRHDR